MLSDNDREYLRPSDYETYSEERLVQIAAARRRDAAREKKATDLYAKYTDAWMAENALLHLEEVVEIGLDPAYDGKVESFLCDFASNFSWDEDSVRQMRSILDDPRFAPVHEHFQKQLSFNLRGELQRMIEQSKEFYENFEGFE